MQPGTAASRRGFRASRANALAAIVVLHAGLLAMALWQHTAPAVEPERMAIAVSLFPAALPELPLAPRLMPQLLLASHVPIIEPPVFKASAADEPQAPRVMVAATNLSAAERITPVPFENAEPQQVSRVEYSRRPARCYPSAAISARLEGSSHLRVVVGEDGQPRKVEIARSSGHTMLDAAAIQCVMAARFKPYIQNGLARAAVVVVPIDFTLRRKG